MLAVDIALWMIPVSRLYDENRCWGTHATILSLSDNRKNTILVLAGWLDCSCGRHGCCRLREVGWGSIEARGRVNNNK